jgi:quercetin dioxygenase-like cupin family protein
MKTKINRSTTSEHPRYILGGVVIEQHLAGADTNALFSLFWNMANHSSCTPIHVHAEDNELIYLLEGEMTAVLNGKRHVLTPGEPIFLPRRNPHELMNESDAYARHLLFCTTSGFEDFLAEGGRAQHVGEQCVAPSRDSKAHMRQVAPKFGITLLQDWCHILAS